MKQSQLFKEEKHAKALEIIKSLGLENVSQNELYVSAIIGNQCLSIGIDCWRNYDKFNITLTENTKDQEVRDVYLNKDIFQRMEINVSELKPVETIVKDIKRRILDTDQFKDNETYIQKQLELNRKYYSSVETNKKLFSDIHPLIAFNRGHDNETASLFLNRFDGTYFNMEIKSSGKTEYCELTLRGLTSEEWKLVMTSLVPVLNKLKDN